MGNPIPGSRTAPTVGRVGLRMKLYLEADIPENIHRSKDAP